LQQIDAGVPPEQAVQELAPALSPAAVEAAVRLAALCSYDFTCLAIVLSGLASDSVIERAEFLKYSVRSQPDPNALAAGLLGVELPPPSATVAPPVEGQS
jgi:hypothetical protein